MATDKSFFDAAPHRYDIGCFRQPDMDQVSALELGNFADQAAAGNDAIAEHERLQEVRVGLLSLQLRPDENEERHRNDERQNPAEL
jgi:hypothetical protein